MTEIAGPDQLQSVKLNRRKVERLKVPKRPRLKAALPTLVARAIATTKASMLHAVTSSTAAQAVAVLPSDVLKIPRSCKIRTSTGKAVMLMEIPMNRAKARNEAPGLREVAYSQLRKLKQSLFVKKTDPQACLWIRIARRDQDPQREKSSFHKTSLFQKGNRTFDLSRPFYQFGARQCATRYPSARRGRGYGTTATAGSNDPALPARHWRQPEKQ
jgi:hypothetical protein